MARTRRETLTMMATMVTGSLLANQFNLSHMGHITDNKKLPDGIFTAVLTPLDENLNADHGRLVNHINWLLNRGNDGIGLLGTTGEANSFSVDERKQMLEAVIASGVEAHKLLVGTGCASLTDTVTLTKHAAALGVGGILMLPPFYYKQVTDAGIEIYFAKVLEKVGDNSIQIYLYHFPQMSGIPFSANLVERLVTKFPENVVGMKDSGGDWSHMEQVLKTVPGFRLYAGNEKYLLPVLKAGGVGCISASANLTSPEAAIVYEAWKKAGGDKEQARLSELREVLEKFPSIGTLKYLFAKLSGQKNWLNIRPPNTIITSEEGLQIEQRMKELDYFHPI